MTEQAVIIIVRDPDADNEIECFGCDPLVIDVDLGRPDLNNDWEWEDWIESQEMKLAEIANPQARAAFENILASVAEQYGHGYGRHA